MNREDIIALIDDLYLLVLWAFATSSFTAAIGLGGGILLLAIMSLTMPLTTAIPLHGALQLASNLSRFAMDIKTVRWEYIPSYALGATIGALAGYAFLDRVPETYLPLGLGIFILILLWTPFLKRLGRWLQQLWLVAAIQSFFALFVGSTGLLSPPILMDKGLSKNEVIVTHAVQMSVMHSAKILAFVAAGFGLREYLPLTAAMMLAAILGSWAGKFLRQHINETYGRWILKTIISLLACKLILSLWL